MSFAGICPISGSAGDRLGMVWNVKVREDCSGLSSCELWRFRRDTLNSRVSKGGIEICREMKERLGTIAADALMLRMARVYF